MAEETDVQPGSSPENQTEDSDSKESSKEQHVPFSRFKAVNDELRQSREILTWIQQNFESPKELMDLLELKKTKGQKKGSDGDDGDLTEEQKAAIRKLLRSSDPNYEKLAKLAESGKLDEKLKESEQSEEDLVTDTHDEILKLVKERKLPTTDDFLSRLGSQIMVEITQDEKLYRKWQKGDTSTVRIAWERLEKDFYGVMKGQAKDLQTRQQIARLPTLPKGGTAITEKPKDKGEPQGITKTTHKAAWDYLKSVSEE
jgi:hypothetical protein